MAEIEELINSRIQESLRTQSAHYDALISRIQTMFAAATAIAGLGIPLSISRLPSGGADTIWLLVAAVVPVGVFVWSVIIALLGLRLRSIQQLDDPEFYAQFRDREVHLLHSEELNRIREYYTENEKIIQEKVSDAKRLNLITILLTGLVIAYAILVTAYSANWRSAT